MRASSLAERGGAEDVAGLSLAPKPWERPSVEGCSVGEHRVGEEAGSRGPVELHTRENAGTSSEQARENRARRKPKVSHAMPISVGLVGPKPRAKAVGDGQPVNTPAPAVARQEEPWGDAGGKAERGVGDAASKLAGERRSSPGVGRGRPR